MNASHFTLPVAAGLLLYGCGLGASAPEAGCELGGAAVATARLRGAVMADVDWKEPALRCEGGPRPDGKGLRIAVAGPAPDGSARQLRLVFGIAPATGGATHPTNVTVILEGEGRIFATLGDDKCTTERLERSPLPDAGRERIVVRGFCTGPATALGGDGRVVVQTFDFTVAVARSEDPPT